MSYMVDPFPGANGEEPPGVVWGGSYRSTYYYLHFYLHCTITQLRSAQPAELPVVQKVQRSVDCGNISAKRNQQDGSTRTE